MKISIVGLNLVKTKLEDFQLERKYNCKLDADFVCHEIERHYTLIKKLIDIGYNLSMTFQNGDYIKGHSYEGTKICIDFSKTSCIVTSLLSNKYSQSKTYISINKFNALLEKEKNLLYIIGFDKTGKYKIY